MSCGRSFALVIGCAFALFLTGCSGPTHFPVVGKVVWQDGQDARELAGGAVEFQSADGLRSARGEITDDATFALSSSKPGDGVPPGEYSVVVMPPPSGNPDKPTLIIARRFLKYDTSGLTFTVLPEKNEAIFMVERAKK